MIIHCDGSGWNGKVSRAMIVIDDSSLDESERCFQKVMKESYTNNEAEYIAMMEALARAGKGDVIITDSQLVMNQVLGNWKVKEERLKRFNDLAKGLYSSSAASLIWKPRSENLAGKMIEKMQRQDK